MYAVLFFFKSMYWLLLLLPNVLLHVVGDVGAYGPSLCPHVCQWRLGIDQQNHR
jgi:hypothetical protein